MNAPHPQMHTITLGEKVHFFFPLYPVSPWKQELEPNQGLLYLGTAQWVGTALKYSPVRATWTFDPRKLKSHHMIEKA